MPTNQQQLQFVLSVDNGQFNASMQAAGQTLQVFNGQLNTVNGNLQVTEKAMLEAGAASLQLQANVAAFGAVAGSIFAQASAGFRQYQTAIADLRKVTGQITDENLPAFEKALSDISAVLPNTREELLSIGMSLAQLGFFAKDSEATITSSMSKIIELVGKVAIATDLSAQEAGQSFGVLKNIFIDSNATVEESVATLTKFANVANELSNTTASTAGYIIRFNNIVGATAKAAGLSFEQTSGFGAAIANLGKTADVAGTAIQGLFLKANQKADAFGKAIGISGAAFKKAFAQDPNQAIITWLDALNKATAERRTQLIAAIGAESRATSIIQGLANNVNILREAQITANKAAQEGTSLDREVGVRLQTLQVQYDKLSNSISKAVTDGFAPFAQAIAPLIVSINNFIQANPGLVKAIGVVGVAVAGILATVAGITAAFIAWKVAGLGVATTFKSLGGSIANFYTATDVAAVSMQRAATAAQQNAIAIRALGPAYASAANAADKYAASMQRQADTSAQARAVASASRVAFTAASVGVGVAAAFIADAVSNLTNTLEKANGAFDEFSAGKLDVASLKTSLESSEAAVEQFNNTIGGMLVRFTGINAMFGSNEEALANLRESVTGVENAYEKLFSKVAKTDVTDSQLAQIKDESAARAQLARQIARNSADTAEARGKAAQLAAEAFQKEGADGVAALRAVQKATKLTEAETVALARRIDDFNGRAKGATGSLVAGLTKAAEEASNLNAELKLQKDLTDRLKKDAESITKQREEDAKLAKTVGDLNRRANDDSLQVVEREQAANRLRKNAEAEIAKLKQQQLLAQQQLADPTIRADLEKRKQLEDSIPRLIKEQEDIQRGVEAAVKQTLEAETDFEKSIRESNKTLAESTKAVEERKAAELEFLASVANTEQRAIALRRQASAIRLEIISQEQAAALAELNRTSKKDFGEKFKDNKAYQIKVEALEKLYASKRRAEEDKFQQERVKAILDANKELQTEIGKGRRTSGQVFDADENLTQVRELTKQIREVTVSLADPEKRLERIKQIQAEIADIVTNTQKKYDDAAKAVADMQQEIKAASDAQKLLVEEAQFEGRTNVIDTAIEANRQRGAGEINSRQAQAQIDAAKREAAINVQIAKAKEDNVITDKEQDAITAQRLAKLRAEADLRTTAGRREFELQQLRLQEEDKIARSREKLTGTAEAAEKKKAEDATKLAELQKAAADAQANLTDVLELQTEYESSRLATVQQVLNYEQLILKAKEAQNAAALKNAGATSNVGTPSQGIPAARTPTAPTGTTTTQPQAAGLPNVTASLANADAAVNQLSASLKAAGDAVVSASTKLATTASVVGTNIEAFTTKATESLAGITDSLASLDERVTKALDSIDNINKSIAQVQGQ